MRTRAQPTVQAARAQVRAAPPPHAPIQIARTDDPAEPEAERVAASLLRTSTKVDLEDDPAAIPADGAPPIVHDALAKPGFPGDRGFDHLRVSDVSDEPEALEEKLDDQAGRRHRDVEGRQQEGGHAPAEVAPVDVEDREHDRSPELMPNVNGKHRRLLSCPDRR